MTRLPRITRREVIAALRKAGFQVTRIEGSHHFLRHPDGRGTVVPVHSGETIGPGLLAAILRDCEIERDELIKLEANWENMKAGRPLERIEPLE